MSGNHDTIVVGAGSTGATVAARLAQRSARRVLLVEAGRDHPDERRFPPPWLRLGATAGASGPLLEHDWGYVAQPPRPGGAPIRVPRGRLVGGTSEVNGAVAVRGRPEDFERWVAAGASGWSWDAVLAHYEAAERELSLMTYPEDLWMPIQRVFVDAVLELGFRYVDDMNHPAAWDGVVGRWPRNRRNEIRQGSLVTYVRQARELPNFELRADTHVDRLLLSGTRVTGVRAIDADDRVEEIAADEVILSAGAYGTPPILLRSGIGPAEQLARHGLPCIADLPVGSGLMEHPGIQFTVVVTPAAARMGWPNLAVAARGEGYWSIPIPLDQDEGIAAVSFFLGLTDGPLGSVALRSARPHDAPVIDHAYGSMIASNAFRQAEEDFRALLGSRAFRGVGARALDPDTPLSERVATGLRTGTHPAGGCRIGEIVDPDLRVIGIDGLRVADASIFPRHVTNNPNLTCHMVGERLATLMTGEA